MLREAREVHPLLRLKQQMLREQTQTGTGYFYESLSFILVILCTIYLIWLRLLLLFLLAANIGLLKKEKKENNTER